MADEVAELLLSSEPADIVQELVPPVPVAWRDRLLEIAPELVLLQERLGEAYRIGAVRDQQHDFDAVFAESPVVSFETFLEALPPLIVRQPDYQRIEQHADQSANSEVVKYLVPRLRILRDREAEPRVSTQRLSRKKLVFVRQEHCGDAQNGDHDKSYVKKTVHLGPVGPPLVSSDRNYAPESPCFDRKGECPAYLIYLGQPGIIPIDQRESRR